METTPTTPPRGAPQREAPAGPWEVVDTSLHALLATLVLAGTIVASAAAVNYVSERIGALAAEPPAIADALEEGRS